MKLADRILLTGAGFTHNFGAPLAETIWNSVLSHAAIRDMPKVRELLLHEFDFESVYHTVLTGTDYCTEEQDALHAAVVDAYQSLDEGIRAWNHSVGSPYPVNIYKVRELVRKFAGSRDNPGFVFTVNQDLFIERWYADGPTLLLPGLNRTVHLASGTRGELNPSDQIALPESFPSLDREIRSGSFNYVKLHGSFNWIASDGTQRMIIGHGKADQITSEPLLASYLDVFNRVVSSGKKRLLVIGYGFKDEHINAGIANGVEQDNLELFVISPQSPSRLRESLEGVPYGTTLWGALHGHCPHTLLDIFTQDQSDTQEWRNIRRSYFDERL